jgi:hypothetical protein
MSDAVACINALSAVTGPYLHGATVLCSLAIALFFFKFWRRSRDRLFIAFAIAFVIFAISRVAVTCFSDNEARTYPYVLRLAAFLTILWAIIDKNRRRPSSTQP